MKYGAFMLRLNAPGFKGCIVKQCPEKSESSFMLFMKTQVANYSCEFKDGFTFYGVLYFIEGFIYYLDYL